MDSMKTTFLLTGLVLLLFAGPSLVRGVEENFPRHLNPSQVQEETPPPEALFSIYSGALSDMAVRDWDSALSNFDLADRIYSTESLQPTLSGINSSGIDFTKWMKKASRAVENARMFVKRIELERARKKLENARFYLAKAKQASQETSSSIDELASGLGIDLPRTVRENLREAERLMENYSQATENQSKVLDNDGTPWGENLRGTRLTLELEENQAVPGSEMGFSGELETEGGSPLEGKTIEIYVSDNKVMEIETRSDGRYSSSVKLPSIYRENIQVQSVYYPSHPQKENIAPSSSAFTTVDFLYEFPSLRVDVPSRAYPGKKIEIVGSVALDNRGLSGIKIRADLMGENYVSETGAEGEFSINISVPTNASAGSKDLELKSLPQDNIAPENSVETVSVVKIDPEISFTAPAISIMGMELTFEGEIKAGENALEDSEVVLNMGDKTVSTRASEGGEFEVSVRKSLFDLSGQQNYYIQVYPEEPWISDATRERKVTFLNPITISIILIAAVSLPAFLWSGGEDEQKFLRSTSSDRKETIENVDEGGLGGIEGVFVGAMKAVGGATGLILKRNQTLREYLSYIKGKIGKAYEPFERLSLKFEEHLYSDHEVEEDRSLLERIMESLGGSEG